MNRRKPTICFFGTYRSYYSRNKTHIKAFEDLGWEVLPIHQPLLEQTYSKAGRLHGLLRKLALLPRALWVYGKLIGRAVLAKNVDVYYVGYPGHLDVLLLKPLARMRNKPIVFDVFVSLYDTFVRDRQAFGEQSSVTRLLRYLDRRSCELADALLIDTEEHRDFFCREYGLSEEKFTCVPVIPGVSPVRPHALRSGPFSVFQYSYFAPLHGVEVILKAAEMLSGDPGIHFTLAGSGQLYPELRKQTEQKNLNNVRFTGLVPPESLAVMMVSSDVCLGVFGKSQKVGNVIPNKILDALVLEKPVITAMSRAASRYFVHGESILYCPPGDPDSLVKYILQLRDHPERAIRLGTSGADVVRRHFSPDSVAALLKESLDKAVATIAPNRQ